VRLRASLEEEPAPITSRSPQFVLVAASTRAPLESAVTIVEPSSHDTVRPPTERAPIFSRWADLDVALRVDTLRLDDTLAKKKQTTLRTLVADVGDVSESLRAVCAKYGDAFDALLQHAYEWTTNVVRRAESFARRGDEYDDLTVGEYSSLFVRAILDPMIEAAIETETHAKNAHAVESLRQLHERIVWLNWTVGRVTAA
jgi:hypothetical protein